ncbi:hypothetical protein T12_9842 [Trichinella patagoniensis]|uniref:Uncharacterized protein n=1 Tax=Trichinella patagoniensis TaxID=990121 RepID=A0A0V0YYU7_9BILA|nr:hypothetical protein T12_9842 [Trichinella patagoniensis]
MVISSLLVFKKRCCSNACIGRSVTATNETTNQENS